MRKHILLFILFSCLPWAARGQSAYEWRYWFDTDKDQQLTGTTAENVYDDFLNSLYDLADGSEDVMDDIAENWQKMVNHMVTTPKAVDRYETESEPPARDATQSA